MRKEIPAELGNLGQRKPGVVTEVGTDQINSRLWVSAAAHTPAQAGRERCIHVVLCSRWMCDPNIRALPQEDGKMAPSGVMGTNGQKKLCPLAG